jgi:peptidoglycan biosynthesis protein MviN/MurJ (putative lipid II flippase)
MYASFTAVAVNITLNLLLMRIIGFRAFPLATTISSFMNLAILFYFLPRKIGKFDILPLVKYFITLAIAACAAGLAAMVISNFLTGAIGIAFVNQILNLLISGIVGLAIFYSLCLILGLGEVRNFLKRLLER